MAFMENILFAASEVFPLVKTGGLADVASGLPRALKGQRTDIRIIMPAYNSAMQHAPQARRVGQWQIHGGTEPVTLWEDRLPNSSVKVWLVDHPLFRRDGGPYVDDNGEPWSDNAQRFTLFCRAVVDVAANRAGLDWAVDLVHCNDWQTGLVPALLKYENLAVASVFTVHNLAYQGLFERGVIESLQLPESLWSINGMEFYGKLSFIKGGLVFADMINTVSPNYGREITSDEFGCGLEHLLQSRADRLTGILNGIDEKIWNPRNDPLIHQHYGIKNIKDKRINKTALQRKFDLPERADHPLIGHVGRLVTQKGIDMLIDVLPEWMEKPVQFVILGSGDKQLEQALLDCSHAYPQNIAVKVGYDEALGHQIEAGVDMFLMPSRFEPCGLNQLYSLRYGTIPLVHGVGGLADTVIDESQGEEATGFVFHGADPDHLNETLLRALQCYADQRRWRQLIGNAMKQDFSWKSSAKQYRQLYRQANDHLLLNSTQAP